MGKRLHIARRYDVEWADSAYFNWKIEEFHNLLSALGMYYTGEPWDDEFDVSKEDWRMGIDTLRNYDSLDADDRKTIDEALEALEYGREEVLQIMEHLMNQAEPDWNYIVCSFF